MPAKQKVNKKNDLRPVDTLIPAQVLENIQASLAIIFPDSGVTVKFKNDEGKDVPGKIKAIDYSFKTEQMEEEFNKLTQGKTCKPLPFMHLLANKAAQQLQSVEELWDILRCGPEKDGIDAVLNKLRSSANNYSLSQYMLSGGTEEGEKALTPLRAAFTYNDSEEEFEKTKQLSEEDGLSEYLAQYDHVKALLKFGIEIGISDEMMADAKKHLTPRQIDLLNQFFTELTEQQQNHQRTASSNESTHADQVVFERIAQQIHENTGKLYEEGKQELKFTLPQGKEDCLRRFLVGHLGEEGKSMTIDKDASGALGVTFSFDQVKKIPDPTQLGRA